MANVVHMYCRTLASARCRNGYYHVAEVGWVTVDGTPGRSTLQGMVDWLRADLNNEAFSQVQSGQTARVYVVTCGDHQYIETFVDTTKPDNLRELPYC